MGIGQYYNWFSFERGYIIYNDENRGNDYDKNNKNLKGKISWEYHRQLEQAAGTTYFNLLKNESMLEETIAAGGKLLKAMADAERKKEEMWLESLYGSITLPTNELGYIKAINELYYGEEQFEKIMSRLLYNIKGNLEQADKGKSTLRAPSLITTYINKFSTALRKCIIDTLTYDPASTVGYKKEKRAGKERMNARNNQNILAMITGDDTWWNKAFTTASEMAVELIMDSGYTENSKYLGESKDFQEALEALIEMMNEDTAFSEFLKSYFHLDKVKNNLVNFLKQKGGKKALEYRNKNLGKLFSNQDVSNFLTIDAIESSIASKEHEKRGLAGLIEEWLSVSLQQDKIRVMGKNALGTSLGNKNATDTMLVQAEGSIKITDPYKKLMEATEGESQSEIAKQLKHFYEDRDRKNARKFFVVNTSNKLLTLSKDNPFKKTAKLFNLDQVLKHNFTSTLGGGLPTLPGFGIFENSQSVHNLTNLVYNTMQGAFLDEKSQDVIDTFRQVLATAAANLLFSDYYNVGDEASKGANAIHLFNLDDTYIPLSTILQGMAKAYLQTGTESYTRYISLSSFSTNAKKGRTHILYPREGNYNGENYKDRYGGSEISKAWKDQREAARQQVEFEIRFANNFQDIVKKIGAEYGIIKVNKKGKFDFL